MRTLAILEDLSWEKIVVLLVILGLIFGAKRLPEIGRGLGKGIREFKGAIRGEGDEPKQPERDASKTDENGSGGDAT